MAISGYAIALYCARRYEEAVDEARKAQVLQSDTPVAQGALHMSLVQLKRYDEAIELDKMWLTDFPEFRDELVKAYAK
jgi:Flp pilus assembly protein TadD